MIDSGNNLTTDVIIKRIIQHRWLHVHVDHGKLCSTLSRRVKKGNPPHQPTENTREQDTRYTCNCRHIACQLILQCSHTCTISWLLSLRSILCRMEFLRRNSVKELKEVEIEERRLSTTSDTTWKLTISVVPHRSFSGSITRTRFLNYACTQLCIFTTT